LELKINNQGKNLIFSEAIQQKDITTWAPVLGEIEKMANAFFQDYANDHYFTFQLGAYNASQQHISSHFFNHWWRKCDKWDCH
jgi:hypothetical protein